MSTVLGPIPVSVHPFFQCLRDYPGSKQGHKNTEQLELCVINSSYHYKKNTFILHDSGSEWQEWNLQTFLPSFSEMRCVWLDGTAGLILLSLEGIRRKKKLFWCQDVVEIFHISCLCNTSLMRKTGHRKGVFPSHLHSLNAQGNSGGSLFQSLLHQITQLQWPQYSIQFDSLIVLKSMVEWTFV